MLDFYMRQLLIYSFFFFFLSIDALCQDKTEEDFFFNINTLYQDPDQSIKVSNYFLKNATNQIDKAKALYFLAESKKLKGDYIESIEHLYSAKNIISTEEEPYLNTLILISLAEYCLHHGMDDISKKYLAQAKELTNNINTIEDKNIARVKLQQELADYDLVQSKYNEALETLNANLLEQQAIKQLVPTLYIDTKNKIGHTLLASNQTDKATITFNEVITLLNEFELQDSSIETETLFGLGTIFKNKGEFNKAQQFLLKALEVNVMQPSIKVKILEDLALCYKQLDNDTNYQKYYTESNLLSIQLLNNEREIRNTLLLNIEKDQQKTIANDLNTYYKFGGLILAVLIIVLISYYFYSKKLDEEFQQFEKIIKQIENKEKLEIANTASTNVVKESKGVVIPLETEKAILERLEVFENSTNFTNPKMSLTLIAKQLKTNTKYISEIIRTHKNKNFNTYINELRINYIIKLMQEEPQYLNYKVSYLAEKSGFSSHSAFTVVFKSITKITPKQFVTFLKKSNKVAS
ncbi:helix-turn-helix, AraC type [unidentified eubacterium SCB49]|nr:helix-turn-helix, AraC type [unidentified eubacterium SCB49]